MSDINSTTATATNTEVDNLLGGESTTTETAASVSTTPGKVARNARKANGEKRAYTKRGTSCKAKRVVLLADGSVSERGRPSAENLAKRRVVYIPFDMEYDRNIHGEGVRFNPANHPATGKRLKYASLPYSYGPADEYKAAIAAAKSGQPAAPVKAAKKKAAKKVAKKKAAKKKAAKSVSVPVAAVNEPAPAAEQTAPVAPVVSAETDSVPQNA